MKQQHKAWAIDLGGEFHTVGWGEVFIQKTRDGARRFLQSIRQRGPRAYSKFKDAKVVRVLVTVEVV